MWNIICLSQTNAPYFCRMSSCFSYDSNDYSRHDIAEILLKVALNTKISINQLMTTSHETWQKQHPHSFMLDWIVTIFATKYIDNKYQTWVRIRNIACHGADDLSTVYPWVILPDILTRGLWTSMSLAQSVKKNIK